MGPNHRHSKKMQELASTSSPPDLFPEAWTKRCNEYSSFKPGLVTTKGREGDARTLRGLAGVYQFRINIIVVSSNHHHTKKSPSPAGTILYCHFRRYHPPCSRRLCPQSISVGCFEVRSSTLSTRRCSRLRKTCPLWNFF